MPVGVTPIEIELAIHLVDPDRAAHEISPDGWHAQCGVASSNCPFCNDGTGGGNGAQR